MLANASGTRRVVTEREARLRRILGYTVFGVLPAVFLVGMLWTWIGDSDTGFDLRYAFLPAARDVLDGVSPYPALSDPVVHQQAAYVYPPLVALVTVPLTAVSTSTAVYVGLFASIALVPLILFVLGVRDPRCYLVALVWGPVDDSFANVTISIALALVLAAAWRLRDSERWSGGLLGLAVVTKLFLAPLLVWPLAMRRWRATLVAVCSAAGLALASWAVIGFAGIGSYARLLRKVTDLEESDSYSISGTLRVLGLGTAPARSLAIALAVALVGLAIVFARRGDDRRTFVASLVAALAATPILWQHYLVVLLVAVAIASPRLSVVWLLPVLLWASPFVGNGNAGQTVLVPAVAGAVTVMCLVRMSRSTRDAPAG